MKTQTKPGGQSIAGSSYLLFYPICFSSQAGPAFLWEPGRPAWCGAWDGSCLRTTGAGGSLWVSASILQLALKLLPSSFLTQERFLSPTSPCGKVHQGQRLSPWRTCCSQTLLLFTSLAWDSASCCEAALPLQLQFHPSTCDEGSWCCFGPGSSLQRAGPYSLDKSSCTGLELTHERSCVHTLVRR